jgi:Replication protein C C-terminal region
LLTRDAPEPMTQALPQNSSPSDDQAFVHKEITNPVKKTNELVNGNADLHGDVPVGQPQQPEQKRDTSTAARPAKAEAGRGGQGDTASDQTATAQKAVPAALPPTPEDRGQGAKPSCGLEHLTWKQIMLAASDRFRDRLVIGMAGLQRPLLAGDCVRAAYDLTGFLGISHEVWAEACAALGEKAAAVCVILIDHAMHRPDNQVQKPNGYLRAMIRKSLSVELYLHKSIFGILKREEGCHA